MKRIIATLDDSLAEWLSTQPNQSETVRKALGLYHGDITTDTIEGMRAAFSRLSKQMETMEDRYVESYEMLERITNIMEELRAR